MIHDPEDEGGAVETEFFFNHEGVVIVEGELRQVQNESRDHEKKEARKYEVKLCVFQAIAQGRHESRENQGQEDRLGCEVRDETEPGFGPSVGCDLRELLLCEDSFEKKGNATSIAFHIFEVDALQPKRKNELEDVDRQEACENVIYLKHLELSVFVVW